MKSLRESIESNKEGCGCITGDIFSKAKRIGSMVRKDFQRVGRESVLIITHWKSSVEELY